MRPYGLIMVLIGLASVNCDNSGSASPTPTVEAMGSPQAGMTPMPGGCGQTPLYSGSGPQWGAAAAGNNAPTGPLVVGTPPVILGFIFGYPLRAGHPIDRQNKILWVVRTPRNGLPLQIDGHPANSPNPTIHLSFPADAGGGEIYPSIVDVPTGGCWHFDIQWAGSKSQIDLRYGS